MRRGFILLSCTGLLSTAPAAAEVTAVNGTVANGQNITVTGSGFGTTGPTVVLFDDFERGTVGDYLRFGNPQIGRWHCQKNSPLYVNDFVRSGTKSLGVSQYTQSDLGRWCGNTGPAPSLDEAEGGCEGGRPGGGKYQSMGIDFQTLTASGEADEVYFEYSYFIPPGNKYPAGDHNYKTDWLLGYDGAHDAVTNDWRLVGGGPAPDYAAGVISGGFGTNSRLEEQLTCGGRSMYPWGYVAAAPTVRWVRIMNYARASSSCSGELYFSQVPFPTTTTLGEPCDAESHCGGGANSGRLCTGHDQCPGSYCDYVDGRGDRNTCQMVRKRRTGHNTVVAGNEEGWGRLAFNAYARDAVDQGDHYYWRYDDIYVAVGPGARARVNLSNARTWGDVAAAATLDMTICTPTAWNSGSVTCTIRQGAFTAGQTAYLFVVDAAGNVSDQDPATPGAQGFEVQISGSSGDTTPPSNPRNVRVVP